MLNRSAVPDSLRPHGLESIRLLCPWNFPGKNTRVGCHFLLQGIFPTQGWNLCLQHWDSGAYFISGIVSWSYIVHSFKSSLLQWGRFSFYFIDEEIRLRNFFQLVIRDGSLAILLVYKQQLWSHLNQMASEARVLVGCLTAANLGT